MVPKSGFPRGSDFLLFLDPHPQLETGRSPGHPRRRRWMWPAAGGRSSLGRLHRSSQLQPPRPDAWAGPWHLGHGTHMRTHVSAWRWHAHAPRGAPVARRGGAHTGTRRRLRAAAPAPRCHTRTQTSHPLSQPTRSANGALTGAGAIPAAQSFWSSRPCPDLRKLCGSRGPRSLASSPPLCSLPRLSSVFGIRTGTWVHSERRPLARGRSWHLGTDIAI